MTEALTEVNIASRNDLVLSSNTPLSEPMFMEAYWCHGVQKTTHPNCSVALTNCSGTIISVPEHL